MRKLLILLAAPVAFLATVAPAQTITVNVAGLVLNGSQASCSDINNFSVFNPTGGGFLVGGTSALVASAPNATVGGGTVQGILSSGASVTAGSSSIITCGESFSLTSGSGSASVVATVFSGPFVNNVMGSGYSGFVRTSAAFGSSITRRATGGAVSEAVAPGAFGILSTVPVTVTGAASGLSNFFWAAQTAATASGTLTGIGAGIQLNSNTNVDATITLN